MPKISFYEASFKSAASLATKRDHLVAELGGHESTYERLKDDLAHFNNKLDQLLAASEKKKYLNDADVASQAAAYKQLQIATTALQKLRKSGPDEDDEALIAATEEVDRRKISFDAIVASNKEKREQNRRELEKATPPTDVHKQFKTCVRLLKHLVEKYNKYHRYDEPINIIAGDRETVKFFFENFRRFIPTSHGMQILPDNKKGENNSYYEYCFDRNRFSLHMHCLKHDDAFQLMTISRVGRARGEKSIKLARDDATCVSIKSFFSRKFPPTAPPGTGAPTSASSYTIIDVTTLDLDRYED